MAKRCLKIPKGYPESVNNKRTGNTMAKRKRKNNYIPEFFYTTSICNTSPSVVRPPLLQ